MAIKTLSILIIYILLSGCTAKNKTAITTSEKESTMTKSSIHQFKLPDIAGNEFDFASLKGKKIMVVNTASECGNTPQYKDLQMLYEKYGPDKFTIIGFPANNFGAQEPGSNEEIAAFCDKNYAITFPMMSKISVKGADMHPLYRFLTDKSMNGYADSEVKWNFQKYLLNEEGMLEMIIDAETLPTHPDVITWIEN